MNISIFYVFSPICIYYLLFKKNLERKKHQFVVPLIYAFISWFLYVPWPGIKTAPLVYYDDALTNWATGQGMYLFSSELFPTFFFHFVENLPSDL